MLSMDLRRGWLSSALATAVLTACGGTSTSDDATATAAAAWVEPSAFATHNPPAACAPRVDPATLGFIPVNQINHDTCGPTAVANLWNSLGRTPAMSVEAAVEHNCMGASFWGAANFLGDNWPGTWPRTLRNCLIDFWTEIPAGTQWTTTCDEDAPASDGGWGRLNELLATRRSFIALVWNGAADEAMSDVLHWVTVIGVNGRNVRYVSYGEVLEMPFDDTEACGGYQGFAHMWQDDPGVTSRTYLGTGRSCHRLAIAPE